jgi:excisionase family DNA binding protein
MNRTLEKPEGLLTKAELATVLSVSQRHVFTLMEQGLPHIRLGRCVRFSSEEVLSWLRDQRLSAERTASAG